MGAPSDEGCPWTTLRLENGAEVERVRYGDEDADWGAAEGKRCHDCAVGPVATTIWAATLSNAGAAEGS
jgi:hypothetical protein